METNTSQVAATAAAVKKTIRAIGRSGLHNEIMRLRHADADHDTLALLCAGYVETQHGADFWGPDDDYWRVVVLLPETETDNEAS